jgi:drug/metabolite transporter (DMT)-like permease
MFNIFKIIACAAILTISGYYAAHNAKWIREGMSPWWTTYLFSFISATLYAYMLRANIFSITYTSTFQTFFFHASWYMTTLFVIGEQLASHRLVGLALVFLGMIMMSVK